MISSPVSRIGKTVSSMLHRAPADVVCALLLIGLAHGLLPLNSGLYQDDWLIVPSFADHYAPGLRFLDESGYPMFHLYHRLVWFLAGSVVGYKVAVWLAIMLGGWSVFVLGLRVFALRRDDALWVALLAWIYPCYAPWPVITTSTYVVAWSVFLFAWSLIASSTEGSGLHRRAMVLVLLLFSFDLKPLLVVHYALFGIAVFRSALDRRLAGNVREWRAGALDSARKLVARWPELLALPLIYWIAQRTLFPNRSSYAGYYAFKLPGVADLTAHLERFGWSSINFQDYEVLTALRFEPVAVIVAIVILWFVGTYAWYLAHLQRSAPASPAGMRSGTSWTLFAAILLAAAALAPYLLTGIAPSRHFYDTRHVLLLGLPIAMLTVCLARLLPTLRSIVLTGVATTAIALLVQTSLYLEARSALLAAAFRSVQSAANVAAAPVVAIDDRMLAPWSPSALGRHDFFSTFDLSGMASTTWGGHARVVFDLVQEGRLVARMSSDPDELERELRQWAPMRALQLDGDRCVVRLQRGPAFHTNMRVGIQSLQMRSAPTAERVAWLNRLVSAKWECAATLEAAYERLGRS